MLVIKGDYLNARELYDTVKTGHAALIDTTNLPAFRENLAIAQLNNGQLLYRLGKTEEALSELQEAKTLFADLRNKHPDFSRYRMLHSSCFSALGVIQIDLGRVNEADMYLSNALATFQDLTKRNFQVSEYWERLAVCQHQVGLLFQQQADYETANQYFTGAIGILDDLVERVPSNPRLLAEVATTYTMWGNVFIESDDIVSARQTFDEADKQWQELLSVSSAPEYLANAAWFYANCPDVNVRNPDKAIGLINKAIRLAPQNADFWSTLGTAYLRNKQPDKSIDAINKAIQRRDEGHARDWFFLAMSQWQEDETEAAMESYQNGVEWMDKNRPGNLELKRIRREAESLLKIAEAAKIALTWQLVIRKGKIGIG